MTTTALITGASAGLGLQFAKQLAAARHDLVLVARSRGPMEQLATELRAAHGIAVEVIACDLAVPDAASELAALVQAKGLTIDVLINNAGYGSNGAFLDQALGQETGMVQLNCIALLELSHIFGAQMRERGRGRILNIASTAAYFPGPFMATYFATKAFVKSFSEALAYELRESGVTVTVFCPGPVATEFASRAGSDNTKLFENNVASAEKVVADAIVAMNQGKTTAVQGLLNAVQAMSSRLAPRSVTAAIAARLNRP